MCSYVEILRCHLNSQFCLESDILFVQKSEFSHLTVMLIWRAENNFHIPAGEGKTGGFFTLSLWIDDSLSLLEVYAWRALL